MDRYVPSTDGPVDLERLIAMVPEGVLRALMTAARAAWSVAETLGMNVEPDAKRAAKKR